MRLTPDGSVGRCEPDYHAPIWEGGASSGYFVQSTSGAATATLASGVAEELNS